MIEGKIAQTLRGCLSSSDLYTEALVPRTTNQRRFQVPSTPLVTKNPSVVPLAWKLKNKRGRVFWNPQVVSDVACLCCTYPDFGLGLHPLLNPLLVVILEFPSKGFWQALRINVLTKI